MLKYQLGLYEKSMPNELSLPKKLSLAKNAGFDYLELSLDETDEKLERLNMTATDFRRLEEAMELNEIKFGSICLSAHRKYPLGASDSKVRKRSLEIMQGAINLAYRLGIRHIQLAGYDVYYEYSTEQTREDFLTGLKQAVAMASAGGITLGFETMETPFMDTVAKAMHYVKLINSPYLGVYPDAGNITNASLIYSHEVADDIRCGAGHTIAVHLKEALPHKYREIPFGTGHVDFQKIIDTSLAIGVRRFVGEFWYTGSETWEADLTNANKFLRSFFPVDL